MINNSNNPIETIQDIRRMLNNSSRVLTLSGWSGIWVGSAAIIGILYFYISLKVNGYVYTNPIVGDILIIPKHYIIQLILTALNIFIIAAVGAIFFTYRKNKKLGISMQFNGIAQKMIIHLCIPLFVGGVFCIYFSKIEMFQLLVPMSLSFYGLALINASKYTFSDIKLLGLLEVLLGMISLLWMKYHIILWTIGFGILHIIYGLIMWLKYDKK